MIKIGFLVLTMSDFDAVLKVDDVRSNDIPDISTPAYLEPMIKYLEEYGTVVYPGVVGEEKTALKANEFFLSHNVDVIVAHEISFTLDLTCLQALEGIKAPILIWNTQMLRTLSEKTDFGQVMSNSGVAGVPQLTNALYKQAKPFKVVTGYEGQPLVQKHFDSFFKAVKTAKVLKTAKFGKIGYVYPGMTTLTVDEATLKGQLGVSVLNIPLRDVVSAFNNVSETDINTDLAKLKDESTVDGLNDMELSESVRTYYAFKDVLRGFNGAGVLCQEILLEKGLGTVPCYAMSRLLEDGIVTTCECDIPTAVAMLITQELAGNAWFLEFYTLDMDRELLMLSHCGYGNCNKAACRKAIKAQPCFPGYNGGGIAYEFAAQEGPVTIVSLTLSPNGRYKLVAVSAEAVKADPCPIACPQMFIRFKGKDLNQGIDDFCQSGAMHHMAVGYGDISKEVRCLAELLDIEFEHV